MLYCEDLAFVEAKILQSVHLQALRNQSSRLAALQQPLKFLSKEISRLGVEYGLELRPPNLYFNRTDFVI